MLTEKIKSNEKEGIKQPGKLLLKLGGLVLATYLGLMGIKATLPKPEPPHMKDIYQLTHIQRNGTRVYKDEYWGQYDQNTKKKITSVYIDSDNNGAPESGYTVFPEGGVITKKYSNTRTLKDIIAPTSTEYHINE
nr:hypothetical protein [Nanoarchaeota archaeon]